MGRLPCCDKVGVKKGPWTPEEDIILVSYIQEHGPGNWRAVPSNTGLRRCSKSCRLRWTNYLRPGIKRGNFSEDEEKMIIHLQALLGNRWAAIASYIPQRTDNDIKNYWNTHLKKMEKNQGGENKNSSMNCNSRKSGGSKGQWERKLQTDINMARQALCEALSLDKSSPNPNLFPSLLHPNPVPVLPTTSAAYASSTENIARLLENWKKKPSQTFSSESSSFNSPTATITSFGSSPNSEERGGHGCSFTSEAGIRVDHRQGEGIALPEKTEMPLSLLEMWLLEEGGQGQDSDLMDLALAETVNLF